jgi:serine/threonine-protein kinase HipA
MSPNLPNHVYEPQDILYLWWLANPQSPELIGDLHLADGHRRVAFTYDPVWRQRGFALSEDLPLTSQIHVPPTKDRAAGAIDDARPDRWGERIIQLIDRPSRLSLLEYLYFAGDDRIGALGVSTSRDRYKARLTSPMPEFQNLAVMADVVRQVLANEPVAEHLRRIMRPGSSLGGARPKSLITLEGEPWIIKFSEGDGLDSPLLEHATMQMARHCGIRTADTKALKLGANVGHSHAVAVRRFDRKGSQRLHVVSAHVALVAAGEELGYPELAQLIRRLGEPEHIALQQQELFRRMVFNILIDNTDDHEKNHALIRLKNGKYELSPAYDVLPTMQGLRYQQMRVGKDGAASTLANALSECQQFGLKEFQAKVIIQEINQVINRWSVHFANSGVGIETVDQVRVFVDGSFLKEQRY